MTKSFTHRTNDHKYCGERFLAQREQVLKHNYEHIKDYGFYNPIISGSIDGTDEIEHDRAILRALNTPYKPKIAANIKPTDPKCTLFIGGLNFETREQTLRENFEKFGRIESVRLVRDLVTGFSKGYAFITFEHKHDAKRAYRNSYDLVIDKRKLIVEFEHERTVSGWKPRRLGGGLGGRKSSGQLRFGGRYNPFRKIYKRK